MSARVLLFGTFDILHADHLCYLRRAATFGNLTIGLGADKYVEQYKRVPVHNYDMRKAALLELPWVQDVVKRDRVDTRALFRTVLPDILITGFEWYNQPYLEASGISLDYLNMRNIALVYLPSLNRWHTTDTIGEIVKRQGGEVQGSK